MEQGKRLLVFHLIDSFTAGIPLGKLAVKLEGVLQQPLQKQNGMFVFQHLTGGSFWAQVKCEHYFDVQIEASLESLDPLYPVVIVPLTPKPSYPFPEETTLIRASLRDERGETRPDVSVRAIAFSESCMKAKLSAELAAGETEIALARVNGRVRVGERYALGQESCSIAAVVEGSRTCKLTRPLTETHPRGTSLLPCVETKSDSRGEIAIAFGNCRSQRFDVLLTIADGEREFRKEVSVEEGKLFNLRAVKLDDFSS